MNNHIQTVMDADINMHNSVLLSTDINSIKGTRIELFLAAMLIPRFYVPRSFLWVADGASLFSQSPERNPQWL